MSAFAKHNNVMALERGSTGGSVIINVRSLLGAVWESTHILSHTFCTGHVSWAGARMRTL
eukprot:COSAG02_NODE_1123_length_14441_cov_28.984521_4_plen_60_part_00